MAGKRDKPEEIVLKLRQVEVLQGQGMAIADAVRQIGVTEPTYYRWRKQYGGMNRDQLKRLKELETENQRLRRAVSDLTLDSEADKQMIQWIICPLNDPDGGCPGKLHSTIVLGPMAENGLILRAVASASIMCGRRLAASLCPPLVRGQWRASAAPAAHSGSTDRHNAKFHAAHLTRNG